MIICYKLASLTYAIASRLIRVPFVGLPNLLAGRELVPEYMQHAVTVPTLRNEIVRFFKDPPDPGPLLAEFDAIHRRLRLDASARAAQAISNGRLDRSVGVIRNPDLATIWQLELIEEHLENTPGNQTTFVFVARERTATP